MQKTALSYRLQKICILLVMCFFITLTTACTSSEEETIDTRYHGHGFSLQPSPNWIVVEKSEFKDEIPSETLIGFTSPNVDSDLLKTFTVIAEELSTNIPETMAFANGNIGAAMKTVLDYERLSVEEYEIDGQKTKIHSFSGRMTLDDGKFLLIQSYLVKNNTAYILSGMLLPQADEIAQQEIHSMIQSFLFNNVNNSE